MHQVRLADWLRLNIRQSCLQDAVEKPHELLEVLTSCLMFLMLSSIQSWTCGATTMLTSTLVPPKWWLHCTDCAMPA